MDKTLSKKRIFSLILIAFFFCISVLCAFCLSNTLTYAQQLPIIEMESKTDGNSAHRGQAFNLKVTLTNNTGLVALKLFVDYDKDVFSLKNAERGQALSSHTYSTTNVEQEQGYDIDGFNFLWEGTKDFSTGVLLTLTFESKVDAEVKNYDFKVSYDANNTKSDYGKTQEIQIINGVVTIKKGVFNVVYQNYDQTVLYQQDSNDAIPEYVGQTPQRPDDEMYTYVFNKWTSAVSTDNDVILFVATYDKTPVEYDVLLYVDGELLDGLSCGYGNVPTLPVPQIKANYTFVGWFYDVAYTNKYTNKPMEAKERKLFGFYQFNLREQDVPKIVLEILSQTDDTVVVNVNLEENPSIAGVVLTLNYDLNALTLESVVRGSALQEKGFTYTNSDNLSVAQNIKFAWESSENSSETGEILRLTFSIKDQTEAGLYDVTLSYDEKTDATFINYNEEIWYTKLNIENLQVPIGQKYYWTENLPNDNTNIEIESQVGMPMDTVLVFECITNNIDLDDEVISSLVSSQNTVMMLMTFLC